MHVSGQRWQTREVYRHYLLSLPEVEFLRARQWTETTMEQYTAESDAFT